MAVTRYFSFGEESTFATAVPATETIDPESAELDPTGDQALIYEGVSRLDRIVAPGPYRSEGSVTTPVDLKVFPWFFKFAMGGYEVTGNSPSYTHRFFPHTSALMPSFTSRVGKDVFEHVFPGCVVSSIEMELDDAFLLGTVEMQAGGDEKASIAIPNWTGGEIYAPHQVNAMINGVDESAYIESFSLKLETGADNEAGMTIGSRFPRRAFRGAFMVELELGLSFFSTTQLERFWGSATGPTSGSLVEFPITINVGENMDIIVPRAVFTTMTQPLSGRDRIEQSATVRGLVASDSTGPIEFSVTNDVEKYGEPAA
ncbi:hypothetical protein IC619_015240 [Hazenella sp. IB182353]|uniref:phage tail tube protein n=1 Tax=Polycladospora coralii TaxID=2771432 RepID=UPI001747454C|nr:phage tail tube protein [Polycladospora coralii]MBS7531826.1 hypothetical protein [Polycladospora coralii]